jgi:hypothetical protein
MTVTDPRTESPCPARPEVAQGPGTALDEPPAGLGPWVPPLPEPEPHLSPRALTWFGIVAVALMIGAAAAVAVVIGSASTPSLSRSDELFLGSVRQNSGLTGDEIGDQALVATGHGVCDALDERPAITSVLLTMRDLRVSRGWSDGDVAAVVGSAIGAYCPRHMALVGA